MRASCAGRAASLVFGSIVASSAGADLGDAFPSPEEAARVNERTVGVVLERDERIFDLMDDIGASLELAAGLRIVPIVGTSHVQNVYDLLYLDGVDLALVRSDSIEYVRRVAGLAGALRLARNVARIGNQKIVVVAGEGYADLDALAGESVGFGRAGSGEFVTGSLLFDAIGVDVRKVEVVGETALDRVRSGELAAMVHLLESPGELSEGVGAPTDGTTVLAVPEDERLEALYRPATLDATDLPDLLDGDETVSTYSVDVNLVAYAWSSENDRTRRVGQFVKSLVDRLEELQGDASQPEWEAVTLDQRTPNIDSSPMVERALAEREAALERWHERRALAEDTGVEIFAVRADGTGSARKTVIGRTDEAPRRRDADVLKWLFDELDGLSAGPAVAAAPALADDAIDGGSDAGAPALAEPGPVVPGG